MLLTSIPFQRRTVLRAVLALSLVAPLDQSIAQQSPWPTKPIRGVVGFAPGGGVDVMARAVSEPLAALLGQSIVIDNKPGAAGNVAASDVIRSAPDGYTILFGTSFGQAVNHLLIKSTPNMARDLIPVAIIGRYKFHLVVRSELPWNSVADLVTYAKANPGKVSFANSGAGTQPHLLGVLFEKQAGIKILHVPYKGSAPALQALLSKDTDAVFDPGIAFQFVDSGKLKMLAIASEKRPPLYPQVPTTAEAGVPGMDADAWIGVWVPTGTPPAVVAKLSQSLATIVARPDIQKRFNDMSAEAIHLDTAKFRGVLAKEEKIYGDLIRERNITLD
jgi:tripartite-type tricarboxylate transporter receptor subunit TctC